MLEEALSFMNGRARGRRGDKAAAQAETAKAAPAPTKNAAAEAFDAESAALALLWGQGAEAAGLPSAVLDEMKALGLAPSGRLHWLGCGLGAGLAAAARARPMGVVHGFEWRPGWDAAARAHLARNGLGARVKVDALVPGDPKFGGFRADALVVFERLWELGPLETVLGAARMSLRPGGLALAVEMVRDDPRAPLDGVDCPSRAPLRELEQWRRAWSGAGFELRLVEEVTGTAIARLRTALAAVPQRLAGVDAATLSETERAALARAVQEAGASQKRLRTLERGGLAVYRFLAARPARSA